MAKIMITPEMLEARAKELRGKKTEHEQTYSQITQLVNNVLDVWEGESQKAFQENFRSKDPTFKKFAEDMEAFATLMDTAAREMRATEESLTSTMRR
jgi:WXG100 family type VII secretion target